MRGMQAGWRAFGVPVLALLTLAVPAHDPAHAQAPQAASPLVVQDGPFTAGSLVGHAAVLYDPMGDLSLQAVRLPRAKWRPVVSGRDLNRGYQSGALWVRFTVDNRSPRPRHLRFRVGTPQVDRIDVHVIRADGRVQSQVTGDAVPIEQRSVLTGRSAFDLSLARAEQVEVVLRAQTTSALSLPLLGQDLASFGYQALGSTRFNGFVLGLLLGLLLYNLSVFFAVRERAYFWYAAQTGAFIAYALSVDGSLGRWLPHHPGLVALAPGVTVALNGLCLVQFMRHLLGLTHGATRRVRILRVLVGVQWVALGVALLTEPRIGAPLATLSALAAFVLAAVAAALELPRQPWEARTVLLGWSAVVVLGAYSAVSALGGGGDLEARRQLLQLALLFERGALAVLLAGRVRLLGQEVAASAARTAQAQQRTAQESEERLRAETQLREREQELLQAQKMEAVGQLAGGLAHDFNNTLQVVLGTAEVLRPSLEDNAEDVELLDSLVQTARQSSAITRHLLMLSRRDVRAPELVRVDERIAALLKVLRRIVGSQITVRFDPTTAATAEGGVPDASAIPAARLDVMQFEQALTNLAINARDAMPGGGTLTVATALRCGAELPTELGADPAQDFVEIRVSDTGVGMSEEVRARIFEPFFTTKAAGSGTGLGLSMVRNMLEGHGGHCSVQSAPGQGTAFQLYFPAAPATPRASEAPASIADTSARGQRLLVVEDNADIRSLLERALRDAGYVVTVARDGRDALAQLSQPGASVPQLIVSDLVMPGLTGWQLLEQVRSEHPTLPFLFCSGYSEEFVHQRVQLDARTRLLPKPFETGVLLAEVREILWHEGA